MNEQIKNQFQKTQVEKESTSLFKSELYDPCKISWDEIKETVFDLIRTNCGEEIFNDPYFTKEVIETLFNDPQSIVVLLRSAEKKIIGYQLAVPDSEQPEGTASYIYATDIYPEFQGKSLVEKLSKLTEDEMKRRGYQFMTRDSAIYNGYALAIEKAYGDRIIEKKNHRSDYGAQRYFKIKL
ncbi:MAG: hypothetical protein WAV73_04375 [Candidatus Moraniibacteriota bacterium]